MFTWVYVSMHIYLQIKDNENTKSTSSFSVEFLQHVGYFLKDSRAWTAALFSSITRKPIEEISLMVESQAAWFEYTCKRI